MVGIACFLVGLMVAAGGVWAVYSLRSRLLRLEERVSSMGRLSNIYTLDAAQPTETLENPHEDHPKLYDVPEVGGLDIVGAWALEQEARGIHVTEEEIEVQRRMWAQKGAY